MPRLAALALALSSGPALGFGITSVDDTTTTTTTTTTTECTGILCRSDDDMKKAVSAWKTDSGAADQTYGPIKDWDTSKVTDMSDLFYLADAFNADIGDWDVAAVTDMSNMFRFAETFNQDIGDWDVSAVTDMSFMFYHAIVFNQKIGDWDVSAVTDMTRMLMSALPFNQDLSEWCVTTDVSMTDPFFGTKCAPTCGVTVDDEACGDPTTATTTTTGPM